jgi:hypothetical protein
MSEKKLEECTLKEATHVEVNSKVYLLGGNEVELEPYHGKFIGIRWLEEDAFIPEQLFSTLGIKPIREKKREPIVFEFIPSLEMAKDMWLPADFIVPMEAVGKKFKCVEILEEN